MEGIFTEGLPLTEEPPTHAPRATIPMLLSQAHRPRMRDELPALPVSGELLRSDGSPLRSALHHHPPPSLQPLYTHTTMTKSKIPYERPEVEFFTLPSYLHSILISFSVEARP